MFISRKVYDQRFHMFPKNTLGRTTGLYGHLPKIYDGVVRYPGYLRFMTKNKIYTFWYMGNPFRHKLFESFERRWHDVRPD